MAVRADKLARVLALASVGTLLGGCATWYDESPAIRPAYADARQLYSPSVQTPTQPQTPADEPKVVGPWETRAYLADGGLSTDVPPDPFGTGDEFGEDYYFDDGDDGYYGYAYGYDAAPYVYSPYLYGPAYSYRTRPSVRFFGSDPFYRDRYYRDRFYDGGRLGYDPGPYGSRSQFYSSVRRFDRPDAVEDLRRYDGRGGGDTHVPRGRSDDRTVNRDAGQRSESRGDRAPRQPPPVVQRDAGGARSGPVRDARQSADRAPQRAADRPGNDRPSNDRPVRDARQSVDRGADAPRRDAPSRSSSRGR